MNTKIPTLTWLILTFSLFAEEGFTPLFNGKDLTGWISARAEAGERNRFSVNQDKQALHVYAGVPAGAEEDTDVLYTETDYSHYILRLEFKWGDKRYAPRTDWDRDAGLLFHMHRDLNKIWPPCLEMQIGESPGDKFHPGTQDNTLRRFHSGDLFVLSRGLQVKAQRDARFYSPSASPSYGGSLYTQLGVEKPHGQWNEMEIQVHGAEKAVFILNGETVLTLEDFHYPQEDGSKTPLASGRIGLQAEWAEVFYRNIRIKNLSPNPTETSR